MVDGVVENILLTAGGRSSQSALQSVCIVSLFASSKGRLLSHRDLLKLILMKDDEFHFVFSISNPAPDSLLNSSVVKTVRISGSVYAEDVPSSLVRHTRRPRVPKSL